MAGGGDDDEARVIAGRPRLRDVGLGDRPRHEVLVLAQHDDLGDTQGKPFARGGVPSLVPTGRRVAAQHFTDHQPPAERLIGGHILPQVRQSGQIDNAPWLQRAGRGDLAGGGQAGARGRPNGEVPAGGVPDDHHA
nr:hypothetical protein [Phenylobacterium sp.]